MKQRGAKIVLLVVSVVLVAVILFLPRQPREVREKTTGVNAKISQATALVQNGTNPMQGIRMLLEVIEEDPKNAEANYRLGLFSMQSGQYEKAIARFEVVVAEKDPKYADAIFYLGQAYAATGNSEKARAMLEDFKKTTSDTAVINGVDRLIQELSTKTK